MVPFVESTYPLQFYFYWPSTKATFSDLWLVGSITASGFATETSAEPVLRLAVNYVNPGAYIAFFFLTVFLTFTEKQFTQSTSMYAPMPCSIQLPRNRVMSVPRHIDMSVWQDPSISPLWTNCVILTLGAFSAEM